MQSGSIFGAYSHIEDNNGQDEAKALIGSVSWLLVSFSDWSMIPIENLIAAAEGTPTRIAALLTEPHQIQGAAFALEQGVDAVVVDSQPAMVEAALIAKTLRFERQEHFEPDRESTQELSLSLLEITGVEEGGVGDRYCIDFTSLLDKGEGMLIGSNATSFMLVHGETISSDFVPVRPFRVNAGTPQSYTFMADGTTKYISELSSGDTVSVVNETGTSRSLTIGRIKIERRPMLLFRWVDENHKEGHMFLQQAETVRAVGANGNPMSVTTLKIGDQILGCVDNGARHIGAAISSTVNER
jgi:3-dehydroquinate synthase II